MADKMSRTARRNQKQPKKKKGIWKKILLAILFVGLAAGIIGGALGIYWIATAPDLDPEMLDVPLSSTLYDEDGEAFATLGAENRELVRFEDLPQVLIDAVIATEDARFFEHRGIDFRRLGGAIVANITDGFGSQGASTITHQVVENFFLSNEKKISIKVQEQWLALQLERHYSKEEIFEMYINKIFYGSNSYGVATAAKKYFGVTDLDDLTLPQAAILAGLPQRPTAYNPFQNPELTEERMNTVLDLMVRHDKISEEEANEARGVDITAMLAEPTEDSTPHGAFIDVVAEEISEKLEGANIYTDGLKINTTLDTSVQERVEFLLMDSEENPIDYGHEDVQGAIVVLDTKSGAIQGLGGRRNSTASGQLNYATTGFQPGSTIKPILVYGPLIEYENISTYHQINDDGPYEVPNGSPIRNYPRNYHGWVTARTALSSSLNVPAVKLFDEMDKDQAVDFASNLGLNVPEDLVLSDALGGGNLMTSPLELAGAFRTFGNEGIYNEPFAVTSVEFPDGSTVDLRPDAEAVIQDYTAYMITDMLKDTITRGTWGIAGLDGLPVAGKTGTTNIGEDAGERWFTGYTTEYTITTLVGGYEVDGNRAGLPDSVHWTTAQQMFRETLLPISEGIETQDFPRPNSVVEVPIEIGTNPPELASDYTPESEKITELFVRGTEPTTTSERFDQLEAVSGLNATYNEEDNSISIEWDYESDEDVSFTVSASIDDGSMQELSTTEDTSLEISEVEAGVTYTIEVIAVSNESSSLTSEPATTSVTTSEEEEDEEEEIPPVSGLSATYDESRGLIDVSWSYDGPPTSFEVTVNGSQSQTVQSQGIEITGEFTPGESYTIEVTPIGENEVNGSTESTSVTIPEAEEPDESDQDEPDEVEEEEPDEPEETEEPDENEEEEEDEDEPQDGEE
jgi:penicillin-binding protein 1A